MSVGFRFDPKDEELINILNSKVDGTEHRCLNHYVVNDCEVYGKIPPWEIYDSHSYYHLHTFQRKLYVFTNLKITGNRVCRAASCGTWLEKSKPKRMHDSKGDLIGIDKMLSFKAKNVGSGKFNKTNWIMHEFSLAGKTAVQGSARLNKVLCVIYKQNKGSVCEDYGTTAMMSLDEHRKMWLEMPSCEKFVAWNIADQQNKGSVCEEAKGRGFKRCFYSAAAAAEEASSFNTIAVISHEQVDAQSQEHRKRLRLEPEMPSLDAGADDDEFAGWTADLPYPDETLSQIFSDLPPMVEVCHQSKSDLALDADIDKELDAWMANLPPLDEAMSQIFSDLPPMVEVCHQSNSDHVLDADIDEDFDAWIANLKAPDEALTQIFSDLLPPVEVCSQSKSDHVVNANTDELLAAWFADPTSRMKH
ncbi:NAC domain-containing protein 82-like [Quercus lobata]|uniref:NAC domain-containing protein n=1 Tax=Quercus lobata TaxID=97700 RepID=A0A7N2L8P6_QUELO|nr:NAC domain-containing protein 82-like [Quercus lobata]